MMTLAVWTHAGDSGTQSPALLKVSHEPASRDGHPFRSFAPVVKQVVPSVVKVAVSKAPTDGPGFDSAPPFLRRFFDRESSGGMPSQPFRMPEQQGAGSGVVVTEDGYILTNNHVVEEASEINVTLADGRELEAQVVGRDPQTDIAVLKIEATDLPALTLADSDQIEVGDIVLAVGNPFGLGQTVTTGIVSAKGRATLGLDYEDFIQTDAAINPGNSGGALVDVDGRLIGINTAILSRSGGNQGIGFAVPTNLARWVMEGLVSHGTVERGYLGVMIQDLNTELAEVFGLEEPRGALISEVTPDSAAEKAGLKSGDVITEFNGKAVEDSRRLKLAVGATAPGRTVEVTVMRDGGRRTFEVALRNASGQDLAATGAAAAEGGGTLAGVGVGDLDRETRDRHQVPGRVEGAVVTQVEPSSAAFEAGLRPGDVITEINRRSISDAEEAIAACQDAPEPVTLVKIWRDGGSRYVVVNESELG
jgi:serine protease Do